MIITDTPPAAAAAVARMRARAACCPSDPIAARAHHDLVRADAASGAPVTEHGRHLASTLRPWPELGRCGECLCGSTLLLADVDAPED
jgi:hypothetical protein